MRAMPAATKPSSSARCLIRASTVALVSVMGPGAVAGDGRGLEPRRGHLAERRSDDRQALRRRAGLFAELLRLLAGRLAGAAHVVQARRWGRGGGAVARVATAYQVVDLGPRHRASGQPLDLAERRAGGHARALDQDRLAERVRARDRGAELR